jgi:hypothetical protein
MSSNPKNDSATLALDLSDTFHPGDFYEQKLALCKGYFRVMRSRRAGPAHVRCGRAVRYGEREVARWLAEQSGGAA